MHSAHVSVCQGRKLIGIKENDDQIRMLCKPAHDAWSAEMYRGTSPLCCIKDRNWSAMCGIKKHTEQTSSKVQSSDMKAIQPWDPHHLSIYISLQCHMLTTIHGLQKHWVCWILASKRATIPTEHSLPSSTIFFVAPARESLIGQPHTWNIVAKVSKHGPCLWLWTSKTWISSPPHLTGDNNNGLHRG